MRTPIGPTRGAAARLGVLASVALALTATACTPGGDPEPSPSPTYSCSMAIGQCTPQQATKEAQAAKDHEAAEAALQGGLTELYGLLVNTSPQQDLAELKNYFGDDELAGAQSVVKDFRASKRVAHGKVTVAWADFQTRYPSSSQQILVCEDASSFYSTNAKGGDKVTGKHRTYTATMNLSSGQWIRVFSTTSSEVTTCER